MFDAGAHIPFMVRWSNKIKPAISDALVSQHDLLASLASLLGQETAKNSDSLNLLETFLGIKDEGRKSLILQALDGRTAYRKGHWMLIPPYWGDEKLAKENVETGACSCYQLYDLKTDPEQKYNVADKYPKKTKVLYQEYLTIRQGA